MTTTAREGNTMSATNAYEVVCYSKRTGQDIYVVATEPDLWWARNRRDRCIVANEDAPDRDGIGYYVRGDEDESFQAAIRTAPRSTSFVYFAGVGPAAAFAAAQNTARAWCRGDSLEFVTNEF
jgi:hypothetical protein